ncbi:MAG: polyprenyl synthetase family protein [Candidatus Nanohaloarchaea archaeon]
MSGVADRLLEEEGDRSISSVVESELERLDETSPTVPVINPVDWREVSRYLADYLVREDRDREVLEELEKHGARLMLSPDQKRIRPGIGLRLFDALGTDVPREESMKLMAAAEGVHIYTKGIDDIQDGDFERNELPTLHFMMKEYLEQEGLKNGFGGKAEELGRSMAENYFLAVKSRIPAATSDLDDDCFSAETREELRGAIDDVQDDLADGQNLDLAGTTIGRGDNLPNYLGGDLDVMEYTYQTNRGKTAEMFALLGRFARIVDEDYDGDELEEWGLKAGQAFQITDDTLDIEKGRYSDIEGNNYTVPVYIAERYLRSHPDRKMNERGERLSEILRKPENTGEELKEAGQIITGDTPAVEAAYNLAEHLSRYATGYENSEDVEGIDFDIDWKDESHMDDIKNLTRLFGYQREK